MVSNASRFSVLDDPTGGNLQICDELQMRKRGASVFLNLKFDYFWKKWSK